MAKKETARTRVLRVQSPGTNRAAVGWQTIPTTTPFGPRLHALAIDHKSFRALSYERLRGLFRDAVGLAVSNGARFTIEAQKAQAILRAARVVAGAETGVRIEGTNA